MRFCGLTVTRKSPLSVESGLVALPGKQRGGRVANESGSCDSVLIRSASNLLKLPLTFGCLMISSDTALSAGEQSEFASE